MEIKIVGSIGDSDEVDTIKRITEVFIIEQRIKDLMCCKKGEPENHPILIAKTRRAAEKTLRVK